MAIEYRGSRVLLPGDLEPPGLGILLGREPWDCDLLLAPHHGSGGSDPPGLADWCKPEWVIVSGSQDENLAETVAAYSSARGRVFHTGTSGAVEVQIDPAVVGGLSVRPLRR